MTNLTDGEIVAIKQRFAELPDDALVIEKIAAAAIDLSPAWLQRDRHQGATIPYIRITSRAIRYRVGTLREVIRKRTVAAD